tara:strand:+ start:22 stop:327 length:306 start_codon:yes stop_codon:yes gene_type:complete
MSGPYLMPTGSQPVDQFSKFGHPGKYWAAQTVKNTTVDFTGSNFGYGAVVVGESSAAGTIFFSGGGTVNIAHLTVGTIYELSPSRITESGNKSVYVFKRQQ